MIVFLTFAFCFLSRYSAAKHVELPYIPIEKSMDLTVDPCDDFYTFACGNWAKHAAEYPTVNDTVQYLEMQTDIFLKQFFSKAKEKSEYPRWVNKAIKTYRSCVNKEPYINYMDEKEKLLQFLDQIGGWPILGLPSWNESTYRIGNYARKIVPILVYFISVYESTMSSERLDAKFSIGIKNNYDGLLHMVPYMNGSLSSKQIHRDIIEMHDVLKKMSTRLNKFNSREPEKMTIERLQSRIPYLNWIKLFQQLYYKERNITITSIVSIKQFAMLQTLINVLENNKTPRRAVANFIGWITARDILLYDDDDDGDISQQINNDSLKSKMAAKANSSPIESTHCYEFVKSNFDSALDYIFVHEAGNFDSTRFSKYDRYARKAIARTVKLANWLDDTSKEEEISPRIKRMYGDFAYPEYFSSQKAFDQMHDMFPDVIESDIESIYGLQDTLTLSFLRLTYSENKDFPYMESIRTPMSYFDPTFFRYVVNLPLFTPPFYYPKGPEYLNFGTMGNIITHTMQEPMAPWSSPLNGTPSASAYFRRAKCFEDQYQDQDNFSLFMQSPGPSKINCTSPPTDKDEIYDIDGLNQAFLAYKYWKQNAKSKEKPYPGLEKYTSEQLFFISYASKFCAKSVMRVDCKHFTPSYYRFIGSIGNSLEFARAFKCKAGSRMNPVKKCKLWY